MSTCRCTNKDTRDCGCCTVSAEALRRRVFDRITVGDKVTLRELLAGMAGVPVVRVDLVDPHQRAPRFIAAGGGSR